MTGPTRLVDPGLLTETAAGTPALLGSACQECGTTTFPRQERCPRCSRTTMSPTPLPDRGRLWAYTVQCFAPKPPFRHDGDFTPFGVGYVDLGPVIVESRLTVADPARLAPDLPMRLTLVPAYDDGGTTVLTYAFEPEGER